MDPICHTLTGVALGGTGLRRASPLGTTALVLAANAPDVDVLVYAVADSYAALAFRRGITHGLPALLLWPFVVAAVVLAWDRWVRRRRVPEAVPARAGPLIVLALLGVLSHPVLDWLNTYGMRWLVPLDGGWTYGDALFIVDPWMWLGLGAGGFLARRWSFGGTGAWALLAAATGTLVLSVDVVPPAARILWLAGAVATGAAYAHWLPRTEAGRERAGRLLTAGTGLYTVLMVLSAGAAERHVREAALAAGVDGLREVMAGPVPVVPLEREVVIATSGGYRFGAFRWLGEPRLLLAEDSLPRRPAHLPAAVARAALASDDARDYLVWARFPYVEGGRADGGWWVRLGDARYGRETGGLGGPTIRVGLDLELQ